MSRVLFSLLIVGLIACGGVAQADLVGLDIGTPAEPGSTTPGAAGEYTLVGGGNDIWGNSDNFHGAFEAQSGDFTAIVKASEVLYVDTALDPNTHAWAKAGLMARATLDANSEHIHISRTGGNGAAPQWRDNTGGGSGWSSIGSGDVAGRDVWLRLSREGDFFAASWAEDDGDAPGAWSDQFVRFNSMPTDIQLGLSVTSHDDAAGRTETVTFTHYDVGPLADFPVAASIDLPATQAGDVGVMGITEVWENGNTGDQGAAHASIRSGTGTIVAYQASMLNILDSAGNGHFGDDDALGVVDAGLAAMGSVDNIAMIARGVLEIPADGDYTFGVNSDDGFTLLLPGQDFVHTGGGGGVGRYLEGIALQFWGGRGASDTLGVVNLTAGTQEFVLTWAEGGGGAAVEFFAAPGNKSGFDGDFRLIGQQSAGTFMKPGLAGPALVVSTDPGQDLSGQMASALAALADPFVGKTIAEYNAVNLADGTGHRWAEEQNEFPGLDPAADFNDFATAAKGAIEILEAGVYEIGFDSDDGASLQIVGQSWLDIVADATGNAVIVDDNLVNDSWTGSTFTAATIELEAGSHDFFATAYEGGGGAHMSIFGRIQGDPNWHLLVNGGAGEYTDAEGLQLVPEPSTLAMLLGVALLGLVCYRRRK